MINLSVRKFLTQSTRHPFIVTDQQRFAKMLMLAVIFHFYLLLSWGVPKITAAPLNKMMATVLDVTVLPEINDQTIDVATQKLENEKTTQAKKPAESINGPALISQVLKDKNVVRKETHVRKRSISAAMHKSSDAAYLTRWQNYVEQFGNEHYPDIALKNNLMGDLRLLVAINKDGSVHEVKIRQSSGSSQLDEAAIKLVYEAAPYEALPPEIAQDIEILEIIRTWQFRGSLTTS
ncbi:MAG: TonB family protein [Gammaproteobacteria bacterium]|nr:TonB family protein [Gammaproteobacteria bacterium]